MFLEVRTRQIKCIGDHLALVRQRKYKGSGCCLMISCNLWELPKKDSSKNVSESS